MQQWLKNKLKLLIRTPFHPQWLLSGNGFLSKKINVLSNITLLDLGCADRWVEKELASNCRYIGIDYPPTGADLYHAKPDLFANASQLPVLNETIDVVTMFEIIEHLHAPTDAIQEAYRVLKPGGIIWISVPFLYPVHDAPYDFQRLTSFGLSRDLSQANFIDIEISQSLSAIETSCLLMNISLSGAMLVALKEKSFSLLGLPIILVSIVLINVLGRGLTKILPNWSGLTSGYIVSARK